jgi:hypothetical protein
MFRGIGTTADEGIGRVGIVVVVVVDSRVGVGVKDSRVGVGLIDSIVGVREGSMVGVREGSTELVDEELIVAVASSDSVIDSAVEREELIAHVASRDSVIENIEGDGVISTIDVVDSVVPSGLKLSVKVGLSTVELEVNSVGVAKIPSVVSVTSPVGEGINVSSILCVGVADSVLSLSNDRVAVDVCSLDVVSRSIVVTAEVTSALGAAVSLLAIIPSPPSVVRLVVWVSEEASGVADSVDAVVAEVSVISSWAEATPTQPARRINRHIKNEIIRRLTLIRGILERC